MANTSTDRPNIKVSVITRTKNRAFFLKRARAGLAAQTFTNYEWIVVNDGGAQEDVDSIISMPIGNGECAKVINLRHSLGRAGAAITGMNAAQGEYCLIHDDDDALLADALEKLVAELDASPNAVAAICGVKTIAEREGENGVFTAYGPTITHIPRSDPLLMDLAYRNLFMTISTLFRKDVYVRVGGINVDLHALEDWDLWLRLMLEGDVVALPQMLSVQYVRKTAQGDAAQSAQVDHIKADSYLRNFYLRQDIKNQSFGLGYLMNIHHRQTLEELSRVTGSLRSLKKRIFF